MTYIIKHSDLVKNKSYYIWPDWLVAQTVTIVHLDRIDSNWLWFNNSICDIIHIQINDYIEDLYVPTQTELLLLQLEHDIVFVNDIKKPVNYQPTNPNFRKESWRKKK